MDVNGNEECPICQGPTDPDWFCSEGMCPDCCMEHDDDEHIYPDDETL